MFRNANRARKRYARPQRNLTIERIESRLPFSVDIPQTDLAEGNASSWQAFSGGSVQNDATMLRDGAQSLKFQSSASFDTGMLIRAPETRWSLSKVNMLDIWIYGQNPGFGGFQSFQPRIVLNSPTGIRTLFPQAQMTTNYAWSVVHVPLAGGDQWRVDNYQNFDPNEVTSIEIHQGSWNSGFTIFYDGIRFTQRDLSSRPPQGPTPPAGVNPNAISPRVLLYVFDPILENRGGARTHNVYGWESPVSLGAQIVSAFNANSHGLVQYQIVDTVISDVHPYYNNGFQHTDESFHADWLARDFSKTTSMFDYFRFVNENNIISRVESGDIDEVWIYTSPMGATWESAMAGQGAYWINGPVQNVASSRAFPIMGLNYERGLGEALHSFGHRSESVLDHIYGPQGSVIENNWDKFAYQDRLSPGTGLGGIGNIHFPVNGTSDYDYANTNSVISNADDWYNYPNFQGTTRAVSRADWQRADGNWQLGYMNWWYDHLPHMAGRAPDNFLSNWWRYLTDIDQFKSRNANLTYTSGVPQVQLSAPVITGSVGRVTADAWVDGALGRVDLYIDGNYHSSDTLAPYTFEFNTATLGTGAHTLQAKAYELQNGTESVSNTRLIGNANIAPTISGATTRLNYTENAAAILIASASVITDPDSTDFDSGHLTVTINAGANANDRLAIRHRGDGVGQVGVSGNQIRYGNIPIGTFTGGIGATPLDITFNAAAKLAGIQAVARSINFQTLGDTPSTALRVLRMSLTDGDGGTSNNYDRTIQITAVNDAPIVTVSTPVNYRLNSPSISIAPTATVTDADSPNFAGGVLKVWISSGKTTSDQLTFGGPFSRQGQNILRLGVVIGTVNANGGQNGNTLIVSLNANASKAITQSLIRNIRFGTINSTSNTARVVSFSVTDPAGRASAVSRVTINVT